MALVVKNPPTSRRQRGGFDPWVRKIPWRRAGQPTSVLLPGESHGQWNPRATGHKVTKSQKRLKRLNMHAHKLKNNITLNDERLNSSPLSMGTRKPWDEARMSTSSLSEGSIVGFPPLTVCLYYSYSLIKSSKFRP